MRSLAILSLCAAAAHAAPRPQTPPAAPATKGTPGGSKAGYSLAPTQGLNAFMSKIDATYVTANDLQAGCTDVLAIIARGSMEPGNIVRISVREMEEDADRW
jgi:hypothetical protein